jgi:OOP family OmpA-OmpF porin
MRTLTGTRAAVCGLLSALALTAICGSAQAQVMDKTQGSITRCDLYRSLGRAFPPECGGSGQPLPPSYRGKLNLGGPAPATAVAAPPAPAQPQAQPAAAAPAATAPGIVTAPPAIGVGLPILFALDSDVLTPAATALLDDLVEVFKYNDAQNYVIEGHTDITGETSHNNTLSLKRAQAVVRYLKQRGLKEERFTVRGLGSSSLLLPNDGRNERNRRVQVLRVDS